MRFNRSVPSVAFNRFLLSIALLFGLLGLAYPAHAQDADTTPPTFISATTSRDGIEVKVTFSEDIAVSSLVSTLAQRYGVSVGGILKDVMTVTVDGKDNVLFSSSYSGSVLTLRLENPQVRTGQVVKVAYSNVFAREPGGALTDLVGNAVEPFGLQTVTNASVDDSALNFGAQPVLNKSTLSICEGQTGTYGVSLPSQPTGGSLGIGMLFSPYDALYPSSEYLSFNQENWETARTISVYTEVDGDDYTNWGLVYHRLDGVDITKTFDTVIRILILERAHADCNTPARGAPTISGTAQVGQTLTASTSGISDTDGLDTVSYSYQWLADDTDIDGAVNSTYTLQASDNGKTIKVRVTFTDDVGKEESLTSAATAAMAPPPNSPATGAQTISGTAQVGQTLTASTSGISDTDGLDTVSYSYQWLADDTEIDGATSSTYTVQSSDNGKVIKVRVSFTDDADFEETVTSYTVYVQPPQPLYGGLKDGPVSHDGSTAFMLELYFSEDISIGYEAVRDDVLDVTGGSVTNVRRLDPNGDNPNMRWEITVEPSGNDEVTLVLPITTDCDDQGAVCTSSEKMLSNKSSVTIAGPPETAQQVQPENSPATSAPTVTGTARVGETLTADTSGIADADGLTNATFTYQWVAGGSDISGATGSTYTLTASDQGQTVQVRVSFTDDAGNEETLTSEATAAVAAAPAPLTVSLTVAAPTTHDGSSSFTFEIRFSEEPESDFSYKTLRNHAFTVTGGTVRNAERMDRPSNKRWLITVEPDSNGDVTIVLPITEDCGADGAICTDDDRKLSNPLEFTVTGSN